MTTNIENRSGAHGAGASGEEAHEIKDDYNFHDASFRRHYQLNHSDDGRSYEDFYAPAYRYGFELAQKHEGRDWETVQEEAQAHWQGHHPSLWEDVMEAVHYGWREQRDPESLRVDHHDSYSDMQSSFQSHYDENFADVDAPFGTFAPAYEYGYTMATDPDHRTHLWDDLEPTVRQYWEKEHQGNLSWDHYRSAAHHAWYTMRAGGSGV